MSGVVPLEPCVGQDKVEDGCEGSKISFRRSFRRSTDFVLLGAKILSDS